MSVIKTKDGRDVQLDCRCGCCNGLRLTVDHYSDDAYAILTYTGGNFYREQDETFWAITKKKLKKIWHILTNKDYCYSEIVMYKHEYEEFVEYLQEHK